MFTRRFMSTLLVVLVSLPALSLAAPFDTPPEGYTLVAEDDCGDPSNSPHVTRGKEYVFSGQTITGPYAYRDIIFDEDFCSLRYEKLSSEASYKVGVIYVTEAKGVREQTLEANGVIVHEQMRLPARTPGRFIFDIPRAAYADGKPLELKFIKKSGANAVVSYVCIWSTDPRRLPGEGLFWMLKGSIEKDWVRQDRLRGQREKPEGAIQGSIARCIDEHLTRGRKILADLGALGASELDRLKAELAEAARRRDALSTEGSRSPEDWIKAYLATRWAVRRIAFKNPLLACDGLLFVRRHHPHAMHQCARRLGSFTLPGGGICLLKEITADGQGKIIHLTDNLFPRGTFGRPDLSFDGRRIVFGYARERRTGQRNRGYGGISERTAPLYAAHEVGPCEAFQVWEMGLEGDSPPRQLTEGPSENSDPLYLPNGRIAFMSHRPGGLVQCGDWALAYCVFTMAPDGTDVRQITRSKDGEWDPFLLGDGTIGFTRWEYVMKFWSPIQMLWSVRPDGTNPRMIYGSDLSLQYAHPLNYASARQIPGASKLVCVGSAHHNTGAGPLCIVDLAIGPSHAAGLERITPVRYVETPDKQPDNGWYDCPYPLNEKYFLVSYSFARSEADTRGYGLYLFDVYGGKELIYRDEELSTLFPAPVRPRRSPAVVSAMVGEGMGQYGELLIQDVHEGLPESMRGKARYVRIVECHERRIHTSPYNLQVGPDSGFETKSVLGTVPVERDGSAYFRCPAGKSVFFSVLDGKYRALHTMRSVTNVQPGERLSCIGCHEGYHRAPANGAPLAAQRAPSDIKPPPWGVRSMEFAAVVQPVLDKRCVRCHDGSSPDSRPPDLSTHQSRPFMGVPLPVSYYALRRYVKHAPIHQYYLPPGSFGSRVSPLMLLLAEGHYDVKLESEGWRRLCAWIDCNAPGIGSYEVADVRHRAERDQELRKRLAARRTVDGGRRKMIAEALPDGESVVCYLDCGIAVADGTAGGAAIREVTGTPYAYGAKEDVAAPWYDDISFDGRAVEFEVAGLRNDRSYKLGFSWWDYNNAGREHTVTVSTDDGRRRQILGRTRLPAWSGKNEKPEERTLMAPPSFTKGGKMLVTFTNVSQAGNAVVSEVWVIEKE